LWNGKVVISLVVPEICLGEKCSSHPSKIAHNKKVPGKETSTERVGALRMMRCLQDIFLLPKSDFHQGMMKV